MCRFMSARTRAAVLDPTVGRPRCACDSRESVRSISEPGTLADTSGYSPDLSFEDKVRLLETVDA